MTAGRPQRYPLADTTYWWQGTWGGSTAMDVNTLVVHTTESTGLPDYGGGAQAPNFTAQPDMRGRRLMWHQHFDVDVSSRALANAAGGVETNTLNVTQLELGGTCDYERRAVWGSKLAGVDYVYWPLAPQWALEQLAVFVGWLHAEHGVPLSAPPVWLAYGPDARRPGVSPASYGASPARMNPAQWTSFRGVCGHSHVPENDHGDPGDFPISTVLAMAAGTHQPEEPMTTVDLTADTVSAIAKATWDHRENSPTAEPGTDPSRRTGDLLRYDDKRYALVKDGLEDVRRAIQMVSPTMTDQQVQALAVQVSGALAADDGFAGQLAEKIAELAVDKIAERLAATRATG